MAGRKHGIYGQVQMDPAGGTAPVTVADLNGWTLNMTRDRVEATAFGDTNKIRVMGLPDYSGTIAGFWNSASSPAFFDVALGDVAATLRLIPNRLEPTYYFEGLANIDGSINVAANGVVSIAGNWDAAANWTMAP